MLPVDLDTVRVFLHVLGATVWVGGQIALAAVVPVVRGGGAELLRAVAHRFQLVAWSAFALLLATGVWNLFAVDVADQDGDYLGTLAAKLAFVTLSGICAAAHALLTGPSVATARDEREARRRRARSGALAGGGLLFALAAVFYGVVLNP
ncbi:MAG TPA: CopD family protein [Acidimicrobiia bacterium]|nr:CopD family protein [Acidimicrobiia bacterium]